MRTAHNPCMAVSQSGGEQAKYLGYPDYPVDTQKGETMNDITFSNALREQFRDPHAYLEQLGNVLFGLFRVLGWWVAMTAIYTSAAAIFAFITQDLSAYSQGDLQEGMRVIVTFAGWVAALACFLGNTGGFRDVFSARARDEVERFRAIRERVESQIDTTEGLLVKHGLIAEDDVERRRADVERRAATVSGTSSTR